MPDLQALLDRLIDLGDLDRTCSLTDDQDMEFVKLCIDNAPRLAKAVRGVLDVLDAHPAPRKEADPTGYATARLELLEHRVREAITEALGDDDDQ